MPFFSVIPRTLNIKPYYSHFNCPFQLANHFLDKNTGNKAVQVIN